MQLFELNNCYQQPEYPNLTKKFRQINSYVEKCYCKKVVCKNIFEAKTT
jgi:uncharacterized protein YozE (UPF0346 family)